MANVLHLDDKNFASEIGGTDLPVVVDFWAEWCMPCRMLAPIVEEIADDLAGSAKVGKLNIDESGETASRYGVMSIPTIIVFKGGKEVDRLVGVRPKQEIEAKLRVHI